MPTSPDGRPTPSTAPLTPRPVEPSGRRFRRLRHWYRRTPPGQVAATFVGVLAVLVLIAAAAVLLALN